MIKTIGQVHSGRMHLGIVLLYYKEKENKAGMGAHQQEETICV